MTGLTYVPAPIRLSRSLTSGKAHAVWPKLVDGKFVTYCALDVYHDDGLNRIETFPTFDPTEALACRRCLQLMKKWDR